MDRATFDKLLQLSVKKNVSDIHLQVGYAPLFRINGALVDVKIPELTAQPAVRAVLLRHWCVC